jgi:uncharacterized protein (TIGR02996 family)
MGIEEALLRAVLADPDDDAPRLIYADWLDEQGQCERAEFIRVQVALARMAPDDLRRRELARRERRFVTRGWVPPLPPLLREWGFDRGFVNRVTYNAEDFLRGAATLFGAAPVRHLRLLAARGFITTLVGCPYLAHLLTLDLSGNALGDVAVHSLCHCPHLANLTSLDLTANRVRRGGSYALMTSPYLTSLEALDLGRNPSLNGGAKTLLRHRFGDRVHF